MTKKYLILAGILIVLVVIIVLVGQNAKNPEPMPPLNPSLDSNPAVVSTDSPKKNQSDAALSIVYTDNGFNPNPLTVKKGDTVTFKNESSSDFWPASAMHPTHVVYGGTTLQEHCPDNAGVAFDACKGIPPGSSWSFKFDKTGSWNYHDHLNASRFGKVIVE